MTKDKIRRLLEVEVRAVRSDELPQYMLPRLREELAALQAEFEAWEPDRERDEARRLVWRLVNSLAYIRLEGGAELVQMRKLAEEIRGQEWLKGYDGSSAE